MFKAAEKFHHLSESKRQEQLYEFIKNSHPEFLSKLKDYLNLQSQIDQAFSQMRKNKSKKEEWNELKEQMEEKFHFNQIIEEGFKSDDDAVDERDISFTKKVYEYGLGKLSSSERSKILEIIDQKPLTQAEKNAESDLDKIINSDTGRFKGKGKIGKNNLPPRSGYNGLSRGRTYAESGSGEDDDNRIGKNKPNQFVPIEDVADSDSRNIEGDIIEKIDAEEDKVSKQEITIANNMLALLNFLEGKSRQSHQIQSIQRDIATLKDIQSKNKKGRVTDQDRWYGIESALKELEADLEKIKDDTQSQGMNLDKSTIQKIRQSNIKNREALRKYLKDILAKYENQQAEQETDERTKAVA